MGAAVLVAVLQASSIDGGLALTEVEDVVAMHRTEVAGCGRASVDFSVVDGGVELASSARDAGACFVEALRRWQFPVRARASVRYDWVPTKKQTAVVEAPAGLAHVHRGNVSSCFRQYRKATSDEGLLRMQVTSSRSGAVLDARLLHVAAPFTETKLGECVLASAWTWRLAGAKALSRATLEWYLVSKRPEQLPDAGELVTDFEPEYPTVADLPFHAALLEQTKALEVCRVNRETLVELKFTHQRDGGLTVSPMQSNPTDALLEVCAASAASKFKVPLKPGESHVDAWLFFGDGGITAYQTSNGGGLAKEVILAVIKEHQSEVKACYEAELRKADVAGKLQVKFIIGSSGSVIDAGFDIVDPGLQPVSVCVMQWIPKWKFPPPAGGGDVTVIFPWILKAANGPADGGAATR
ncbi:MAG: AgmX/PglI C-terminal domain-containing protein [Myxococcaceae bacterium]|nr:AgmX/PglI C-terminal domain-containing protein [Myxococcaceae bacterium]